MENIGEEVLVHIFSFFDVKTLCISSQVCRQWYDVASVSGLWKSLCEILCKKENRPLHLGRADSWKERFIQLYSGRIYPRKRVKVTQMPSFEELRKALIPTNGSFVEFRVKKRQGIREFIQSKGLEYVIGNAFYQHTKTETISFKKKIVLKSKENGAIYEGEVARNMVGLRKGTQDWNIHPETLNRQATKDFLVFVQSTSVNRALVQRTTLLYKQ